MRFKKGEKVKNSKLYSHKDEDPCYGIYKYAEAVYHCKAPPSCEAADLAEAAGASKTQLPDGSYR